MTGKRKRKVALSPEERERLQSLVYGKSSKEFEKRARILLLADEGEFAGARHSDKAIAGIVGSNVAAVERIRRNCAGDGLQAALKRKKQANRKHPALDGEGEAHLVAPGCSEPPVGFASWTLSLLADKMELEREVMTDTNAIQRPALRDLAKCLALALGVIFAAAPGHAEGESLVLVATQKAGDLGPIDGLIDGLEQAEAEFNVKTQFIEALDPATYETTLRTLANRGTDIVITTFFAMGATVETLAPEFPDTRFVVVVAAPFATPVPNARAVGYKTFENAYLSGTFAAHLSETGKIALIAGVPLPYVWADYNAFQDAAKSVNPDIGTNVAFVQSFEDPVKGREVAAGLYAQGVDAIYTGAAASDIGVVEAAVESDNLVIAASPPLIDLAPEHVGFIASFEWARTLMIEAANALSDEFQSDFRVGGVDSGEIIMTFPDTFVADAVRYEAAVAATKAAYAAMANGELVVHQF